MPKLSLWKPDRGKDYTFIDRVIREHFEIGGTGVLVHKYLGPEQNTNSDDSSLPENKVVGPNNVQDLLLLENRDRKYDPDVFELRGVYTVADAEKWENFCKANRKPRKVKPPTPEKIVKKLRYMPEHKSWGVKSINPVEILESKVLVAINATTRKLMVFVCDNLHGIKVNGNQISNWDLERSTMKTLADPQTTLKEISEKQGWRQMLNIIDALPGKKYEPIPKFHKNIILLKAIKQYG